MTKSTFQAGNAQALIDWYNSGADGQIDWGQEGDFEQCVSVASDYVDDPEGFCQLRHIDATGEPAGKGAHGGATVNGNNYQFVANWDAGAALAKVTPTPTNLKKMHAHKDPEGDPAAKASYSFPHHDVNADGSVGAANPAAASAGIGALNGGRGGHALEPDEKKAVYNHLAAHLKDAGQEPPELKGGTGAAKTAAADLPEPIVDAENKTFSMPIMVIEGTWTGDWRYIDSGSLTWRDLPIPAMALTQTTDSHTGADLVGQITSIERKEFGSDAVNSRTGEQYPPGTSYLVGNGRFTNNTKASEISELVREGFLRGVSIDLGDAVSDIMMVDQFGNEVEDDGEMDLFDILFGFAADGEEEKPKLFMGEKIRSGRVMGATICPFPAFEGAYVTVGDVAMSASARVEESGPSFMTLQTFSKRKVTSLAAAAAPMRPPYRWFTNPNFNQPTAIEIDEEGRIWGHLAIFSECHMGYQSTCVNAPHSQSDYAYFQVGCVLTDEGIVVPTGTITMNTGHAELWQEKDSAKAHYDNTGTAVADICAGDDDHGIWIAGALRPDVDELSVRRLRGAALSGDWRQVGGQLELVAALAVNVPGFPITRPKARVASGMPQSLVAAGRVTREDAQRLKVIKPKPATDLTLQAATAILERQARNSLRAEVHPR